MPFRIDPARGYCDRCRARRIATHRITAPIWWVIATSTCATLPFRYINEPSWNGEFYEVKAFNLDVRGRGSLVAAATVFDDLTDTESEDLLRLLTKVADTLTTRGIPLALPVADPPAAPELLRAQRPPVHGRNQPTGGR